VPVLAGLSRFGPGFIGLQCVAKRRKQ